MSTGRCRHCDFLNRCAPPALYPPLRFLQWRPYLEMRIRAISLPAYKSTYEFFRISETFSLIFFWKIKFFFRISETFSLKSFWKIRFFFRIPKLFLWQEVQKIWFFCAFLKGFALPNSQKFSPPAGSKTRGGGFWLEIPLIGKALLGEQDDFRSQGSFTDLSRHFYESPTHF